MLLNGLLCWGEVGLGNVRLPCLPLGVEGLSQLLESAQSPYPSLWAPFLPVSWGFMREPFFHLEMPYSKEVELGLPTLPGIIIVPVTRGWSRWYLKSPELGPVVGVLSAAADVLRKPSARGAAMSGKVFPAVKLIDRSATLKVSNKAGCRFSLVILDTK